ncbi:50S ribosomal protein L4 [Candidatus Falkowbacteria bacterium]|nr:50S ribosomal protein L4 [Candidatus Falkowbacteria bacterium]
MSIKTNVYNQKGEKAGDIELKDHIFSVAVKGELLHQSLLAQMGNERQVIAHTKGRAEVRGGGAKPWRQKGTGRARAGSSRSPIWIGGGVTFGPTSSRNFSKKINKKMRQKAIFMALSDRLADNSLVVIDKFEIEKPKTKLFSDILNNIENKILKKEDKKTSRRSILVVSGKSDETIKLSANNLPGVKIICLDNINLSDLLKYRKLILTEDAVKGLEKTYKK